MKLFSDFTDFAEPGKPFVTTEAKQPSALRPENRHQRFRKIFNWAFGTKWHAHLPAGLHPWTISSNNKANEK